MDFLNVPLPQVIVREEGTGNFEKSLKMLKSMLKRDLPTMLKKRLKYEPERIRRLLEDYSIDEKDAKEKLASIGVTNQEYFNLIENGELDYIKVEGKRKFEKRFFENFLFRFPKYKKQDDKRNETKHLVNKRIDELLCGDAPKIYKVGAEITVTLKKDFEGSKLRCWLPIPKVENPIDSLDSIECDHAYKISSKSSKSATVYMEGIPKANTSFHVKFEYTVHEQISKVDPDQVKILPSNQSEFLKEKAPHILFSKYLRNLTKEIVKNEKNPYFKASLIYDWITKNIDYSYMNAYSIYDISLSDFAAVNMRGDCGVKALLFITMCRICGVPAKWQSGWFISPNGASPHDWAYFYVEPYGWLPADLSFGGSRKNNENRRKFYFGNLDAFRMAANSDFMVPFYPKKYHFRSDPYDNQVGELETEKENIYYNNFDTKMKVLYFEEAE